MCFHKHTGCVFRRVYGQNSKIKILKHELEVANVSLNLFTKQNLYSFGPYGFLFRNIIFLNGKPHKATLNVNF